MLYQLVATQPIFAPDIEMIEIWPTVDRPCDGNKPVHSTLCTCGSPTSGISQRRSMF